MTMLMLRLKWVPLKGVLQCAHRTRVTNEHISFNSVFKDQGKRSAPHRSNEGFSQSQTYERAHIT